MGEVLGGRAEARGTSGTGLGQLPEAPTPDTPSLSSPRTDTARLFASKPRTSTFGASTCHARTWRGLGAVGPRDRIPLGAELD
jgi:hypothetical protein